MRIWSWTTNVQHAKVLDGAIDAAMNAYRRQAATWAALRSPRPVQFIAGPQINVAGQQLVANSASATRKPRKSQKAANEQGLTNEQRQPPALPADPEWAGFAPDFRVQREALDPIHRAAER
jgi:hypothetical protein